MILKKYLICKFASWELLIIFFVPMGRGWKEEKEETTLKCLQDWRRYLHVSKMEYFRLPSSWLPSCLLSLSSSKTLFFNLNKPIGSRVYDQLKSMKNWWKMRTVNILGHFLKFANQSTINILPTLNPSKTNPKWRVNFQFS